MELNSELERLQKYNEVDAELQKAKRKHHDYPTDMFRQVAIMNEDAGEVTKDVLHFYYEGGTIEEVRKELIQTAAMCVRMLEYIDQK